MPFGPAPDVGVNFKVRGLDQVQRGLKLVKDQAEPTARQWGQSTRQIAGGLEQIARTGKVTGESLKQIVTQGAEMAFLFGAGGPIVAALGITGVAIYEGITGRMKQARAEARAFAEEIAGVRRAGNLSGAGDLAQRLFSGDRFAVQQEGESARDFEARTLGVLGLQRKMAGLKSTYEGGIGTQGQQTETSIKAKQAMKDLQPILDDYITKHQKAAAAVNELAAAEGRRVVALAAIARGAALKPEVTNLLGRGTLDVGIFERMGFGVSGRVQTPHLDLGSPFKKVPNLMGTGSPATMQMVAGMKQAGEIAGQGFVETLASTIETGFARIFQKGANIGNVFAGIAESALAGLGSIASQIGKAALTQFAFIKTISAAIAGLNPALGIPAALGLIAFGGLLGGAGHRIGANAGGGGGYGGGAYSASSGYGSTIIDRGVIDPTRGAGVNARSANTYQFTVIGANDPKVQSDILRLIANAERRGTA